MLRGEAADPLVYRIADRVDISSVWVWLLAAVGLVRIVPQQSARRALLAAGVAWLLLASIHIA